MIRLCEALLAAHASDTRLAQSTELAVAPFEAPSGRLRAKVWIADVFPK